MENSFIIDFVKLIKRDFNKTLCGLHEPFFSRIEKSFLSEAIDKKMVSTHGNITGKFENKLIKFTKSSYAIATINGTSALHVSLIALGLKKNEEVLIPNLNYIASANSVLYSGGIPHFIDSNENDLSIDLKKLENYLNKLAIIGKNFCINRKTKRKIHSLITTHVFGHIGDIIELRRITKKFKLKLIEDASEALGSYYNGQHAGTFGDVGVLSFNGNKIITTGGGGAVVTNSKILSEKIENLVKISRKKKKFDFDYNGLGYNYRMPSINAALGLAQIRKLNYFLDGKKKIFLKYQKIIKNFKEFQLITANKNCKSNYWLQGIILEKTSIGYRNKIINLMNKKNINVRPIWKLMHKIKHLKKFDHMDLANSIKLEKKIINLPSGMDLIYDK